MNKLVEEQVEVKAFKVYAKCPKCETNYIIPVGMEPQRGYQYQCMSEVCKHQFVSPVQYPGIVFKRVDEKPCPVEEYIKGQQKSDLIIPG
tara:strand:- start:1775 stop:2044 length:270 start_codon:yes stop_codon:yes gene_type:complete